jgi:hypothetical protein
MSEQHSSTFGTLGRRLVAWIVLIAIAVIAIKVVFSVVAGIVMTILWAALLVAVVVAGLWALRRV